MLARSFLSAAELKITEDELAAMVTLLGRLERDELPHDPDGRFLAEKDAFRMCGYLVADECGTVACIAGWVVYLTGGRDTWEASKFAHKTPELNELCLPQGYYLRNITSAHAAHALSNYLTTGRARWAEALA